jgi:hypothetical protein
MPIDHPSCSGRLLLGAPALDLAAPGYVQTGQAGLLERRLANQQAPIEKLEGSREFRALSKSLGHL